MLELRQSLRALTRNPGTAVIIVATLAAGIGANAAIFTLVNGLLLKPLPVRDPDALVFAHTAPRQQGVLTQQGGGKLGTEHSHPRFRDLRAAAESGSVGGATNRVTNDPGSGPGGSPGRSPSGGPSRDSGGSTMPAFDGLAAYAQAAVTLSDGATSERVLGEIVSGNYFSTLGIGPALGRLLGEDDDRVPGAHPVIVLDHAFWQRRFGGDAAIIGRTIRVNDHPFTVVGVTPASFFGVEVGIRPDVRLPLMMEPVVRGRSSLLDRPTAYWLSTIGRLAPGMTPARAAGPLDAVLVRAPSDERRRVVLTPAALGASSIRGRVERPLLVLLGMVGAMLLLATANVANLLLTRAAGRRREMAVRLALGASPARLLRANAIDGLLLATAGGALGLTLAFALPPLLVPFLPMSRAFPARLDLAPDLRVLAFTTVVALAAGLLAALAPAWQGRRADVLSAMKTDAGTTFGGHRVWTLHRALAVVQIAVSVVLLVCAGLFARTLQELRGATGYLDPGGQLIADIDPAARGYEGERLQAFYRELQQRLRQLPGVQEASLARMRALSGALRRSSAHITGPGGTEQLSIDENLVGPGYLPVMGMTLARGRAIAEDDRHGRPRVAVINETLARIVSRTGQDPIGSRYGYGSDPAAAKIEVVGIVRDAKNAGLREAPPPMAFLPLAQGEGAISPVTIHVRTAADPLTLAEAVRREVRTMDAGLPVYALRTMDAQRELALGQERLLAWLAGAFGLLALGLAALGLFGVLAHAVSRRTRDFGIRLALGADAARLRAAVLRDAVGLALAGLALGLPAALLVSHSLRSLLFGVAPGDGTTLVQASVVILLAAVMAGYLPARRATRVDPLAALRAE